MAGERATMWQDTIEIVKETRFKKARYRYWLAQRVNGNDG